MSSWQFKPVSFGAGELIDNHDGTVSYKVEEGNTLGSLADEIVKKTGQKREKVLADLVRLNGIENQNVIEKDTPYKFPKYEKLSDEFVKSKGASPDKKAEEKDAEKNTSLRTSSKRFAATVTADSSQAPVVTSKDKSIWDVIAEQDAQRTPKNENETLEFGPTDYEAFMMDNPEWVERILKNPDQHSSNDYALALRAKAKLGALDKASAKDVGAPTAGARVEPDEEAGRLVEMDEMVYEAPNLAKAKEVLADPSKYSAEDVAKAKKIFEHFDMPIPETVVTQAPAVPNEAAAASDDTTVASHVAPDEMDSLLARDILENTSRYDVGDIAAARDHFTATGETELAAEAEKLLSQREEEIEATAEMIGVNPEDISSTGFADTSAFLGLFTHLEHPHHRIFGMALSQMEPENRKDALKAFPYLRDMAECDDKDNPGAWELAMATKDLYDDYTVVTADKSDEDFKADQKKLAQIFTLFGTLDIDLKTLAAMADDKKPNGKNKTSKALREDRAKYAEIAKLAGVPDGAPAVIISEIIALAAYRLEDPSNKQSKHIGIAVVRVPKSAEQIAKDKAILAELDTIQHVNDVFSGGQSLFTPLELLPVAKGEKTAEQLIQESYAKSPDSVRDFLVEARKPYKDKGLNIDKEIQSYETDPQGYVERRVELANMELTQFLTNAVRLKGGEREAYAAAVKTVAERQQELAKLYAIDRPPTAEDKMARAAAEAAVEKAVEDVVKALEKGAARYGAVEEGNAYDPRPTVLVARTLSKDAKALLLYRLTESSGGENASTSQARLADKITAEMGAARTAYYSYNFGLAGRDEAFNRDLVKSTGLSDEALGDWKPTAEQAAAVMSARTSGVGAGRAKASDAGQAEANPEASEPYDWSRFSVDADVQERYDLEVLRQTEIVQAERDAAMAQLVNAQEKDGYVYDSDMALLRQGIKAEAELRAKAVIAQEEIKREMERSEAALKMTRKEPATPAAPVETVVPAAPIAPTVEEIQFAKDIDAATKED